MCVDDCGSDNSMEIVRKYATKDARIRILKNAHNIGLGATRNVGMAQAKGEFIYFLDSDDFIEKNAIEALVEFALESEADITVGGANAFPHKSDIGLNEYILHLNEWLTVSDEEVTINEDKFFYAIKEIPCIAWGKLYKAAFLQKNKLKFINEKVFHEDNGFHIKCMACCPKIRTVSRIFYQYRIRTSSLMQNALADEERRRLHLKKSVDDALTYLSDRKKPSKYFENVRDANWDLFALKSRLVTLYFGKYEKRVRFLGVNWLKQTSNDGKTVRFALMGIRLLKFSLW